MSAMKPVDRTKILQAQEIAAVLDDLRRKGRRSINTRQNLTIFRLATCCGLRVSEIVGLKLGNVILGAKVPYIEVPAAIAKRGKARKVPLWWDEATLMAMTDWKAERIGQGAKVGDYFVCILTKGMMKHRVSQREVVHGKPLSVRNAQARFKVAISILGETRQADLSIHSGRHSFCSHALNGGRSLVEVRDAAGHANISTTSIYLHALADDGKVGHLFGFTTKPRDVP